MEVGDGKRKWLCGAVFEEMKNIKQKIKHSPYELRKVFENHLKI